MPKTQLPLPLAILLGFALPFGCGESTNGNAPDAGAGVDAETDGPPPAPGCEAPTGAGTEHQGVLAADETWTAADSPHIVVSSVYVSSVTLTIEPCAVVRIRKGYHISVDGSMGSPDAIVAHGESIPNVGAEPTIRPVVFERDVEAEPWGSIYASSNGMIDLEFAELNGGGDPDTAPHNGGTVIALGEGGNSGTTTNLRVVDVTIDGSGTFGANLQSRASFTDDSTGLVVRNAGSLPPNGNVDTSFPVYVDGPAVSTIPEGTYTGNATDEIFVANAASLTDSEITFHNRGVPYRFSGYFSMAPVQSAADGGLSTLTIEAGVVMRFDYGSASIWSIGLGTSGGALPESIWPVRLIAEGTASEPIVLTSAEETPVAGDWGGIHWSGGPATGNVMNHVHIEYAGGYSGTGSFGCGPGNNDAALIITNWRPDDVFITNSTFSDSAGGGIVSGWISDLDGPNLVGNNTFINIANGCNVSRWADLGGCPAPPPICL